MCLKKKKLETGFEREDNARKIRSGKEKGGGIEVIEDDGNSPYFTQSGFPDKEDRDDDDDDDDSGGGGGDGENGDNIDAAGNGKFDRKMTLGSITMMRMAGKRKFKWQRWRN